MIEWIGPRGEILNSRTTVGDASLPLNFSSLSVADAGSYTCRAVITSPLYNGPRTIQSLLLLNPGGSPGTDSVT